jgi:hypothetical protein
VGADGGRIRIRRDKRAPKTTKWRTRYSTHWREPRLLAGKTEEVIGAIDELCRGRSSKAMAYGATRHQKLPIGSGAVESAIRRVVNLRIKGPGIFWHRDHAELMLILSAFHKAGRWDTLKEAAAPQPLPVAA